MKRLALTLALTLWAASPARAQSRVLNVADFGALTTPVTDNAADTPEYTRANRIAIQSALDAASRTPDGAIVQFPPGTYGIDRPLRIDRSKGANRVSLRSEGARIRMRRGLAHDVLVIGLDRVPYGDPANSVRPDVRVPVTGALDPTVNPQRAGLRTFGRYHVAAMGSSIDAARKTYLGGGSFTVDHAVDLSLAGPPNGGVLDNVPLFGSHRTSMNVATTRGAIRIQVFHTKPGTVETAYNRNWQGPVVPGLGTGILRLTVQYEQDTGKPVAWVNGQPYPLALFQGPPPIPGEPLHPLRGHPWIIGGVSDHANYPWHYKQVDQVIYGHKITVGKLYKPDGSRLDGKPLSDHQRYFAPEPLLAGYLPLTDNFEDLADRLVMVRGPWGPENGSRPDVCEGSAYLLEPNHAPETSKTTGGSISGMQFLGDDTWAGAGVRVGYVTGLRLTDCYVKGGSYGFTSSRMVSSALYPLRFQSVHAWGSDAAFNLYYAGNVTLRECSVSSESRASVAMERCMGVTIDHIDLMAYGKPQFAFYMPGSSFRLSEANVDNETPGAGPQIAEVYISPDPMGNPIGGVTIDGYTSASGGTGAVGLLVAPGTAAVGSSSYPLKVSGLGLHKNFRRAAQVRFLAGSEDYWTNEGIYLNPRSTTPTTDGKLIPAAKPLQEAAPAPSPTPTTINPAPATGGATP